MKLLIILILGSSQVFAGISRPTSVESTAVLPKNIRNLNIRLVNMPSYDKYSNSGIDVGVGNALNKQVSFNDFIDGLDDFNDQEFLKEDLKQKGITDLENLAGQTTGVVNVEAFATIPIFAIGVTKKLTLAVAVPIVQVSLKVDTGFIADENFQKYADELNKTKSDKYDEAKRKTDDVIRRKVRENGYDELSNIDKSGVGDVKLVAKYQLRKKENTSIILTNAVTLPTGEEKDVNKLVDIALGDGQFDYEIGMGIEQNLSESFKGYLGASYNIQIQDTSAERIPEKSDTKLTPDIDSNAKRNLGDVFKNEVSLGYLVNDEITLTTAHVFQHKQQDKYSGNKYDGYRYTWLAKETEQSLSSLVLAGEFSTINLYRAGEFKVPAKLKLTHAISLGGKNTTKDNVTSVEFALFF